ncbi:histidine phosphatase family protein [Polynucleobacter sp. AP-Nino-20-G2]|uniref:histidine phosphatase family protein n=1 Tax=Polynucleobacter sp. AP-Nino-20-G2 TaxID=2576917 RepID=UPI001BFD5653|nr:histidine phosphatase family protein [Polynucleobacter sp. AP-Nino-20-G2]QWE16634.1 histidine phosphatase family protein [Polynucleobacter sp. AP-Nino-20-G2]
MTTTRLCLIRHGETDWNTERRLQGHTDIPLNARGEAQARQMAQALKNTQLSFDALYTSDLKRAADTAHAIVESMGLTAISMEALRERHFGGLQGLTIQDAPVAKPDIWQAHISRQLDHELDGGESIAQFALRVEKALTAIQQKHAGQTILLVSHGGTLDMIFRLASAQALSAERVASVPNASLNWVIHNENGWAVERWADTSHLDGLALDNVDL